MVVRIGKNRLHDDSESCRKKPFGYNSQSFIWYWNNFPVDILFSVIVTSAPELVTLPGPFHGPILELTVLGAVGPLPTSAAEFG